MQIFVSLKDGKSIKICQGARVIRDAKLIQETCFRSDDVPAHYNIQHDSTILEIFGWRVGGGGSAEEFKETEAKAEDCPICLEKTVVDDSLLLPCRRAQFSSALYRQIHQRKKCVLDQLCQSPAPFAARKSGGNLLKKAP